MTAPILLTGGTGTLGSLVLPRLRAAGLDVRVLSRHSHPNEEGVEFVQGDLTTGDGVRAAVTGTEVIVHCAGSAKGDDVKARHLVEAARGVGSPHLVHISVVGADRVPVVSGVDRAMFGYFASKRAAELVVAESGLPWTTLRATQFHELMLIVAKGMSRLPVLPAPSGFRFQPVDGAAVADRMVELALGSPAGLAADIAGPTTYPLADVVRSYLRAVGKHRPFLPIGIPGRAARAIRGGANLAPDRAAGRSWEDFLAEHTADESTTRTG